MQKRRSIPIAVLSVAALAGICFGWDSKIHPGIVRAALATLPADDRIQERLGDEVPRLMQYVQLGDWVDTLVAQRESWDTGGQTLELHGPSFFADDFLLFPASPTRVQHMLPDVKSTYRPFFLRALQALRTESPSNAARWMGSLLHFVTDSGSPPHVIGVKGADHTKMESWLDTSLIDLRGYVPQFLGDSDEAAVQGLAARMEQLAAYSAIRANKMLPLVKANDRAAMEPLALECAAETARVSADVIHTLLKLSGAPLVPGGSLTATVSASTVEGIDGLAAKLVVLGTSYSTLSDAALPAFHGYRGAFRLRNLPPGEYRMAVERVGSRTLYLPAIQIAAGKTVSQAWELQPDAVTGNLAPNPDLSLHWTTRGAPDHWRFDAPRHQWLSDNIPVVAGRGYRAGFTAGKQAPEAVELQWMAHAWEAMKTPAAAIHGDITATAPEGAMYARFVVRAAGEPSTALAGVFLQQQ